MLCSQQDVHVSSKLQPVCCQAGFDSVRDWGHSYSDYTRTESGLQYQDLREGTGKGAKPGAQVTVDWDGYTIGADLHHPLLVQLCSKSVPS
jgi:hypothetical protein